MYSLNLPVSTLRTKVRQEFERHRYVKQLPTVDVLLFNSHQEFQVLPILRERVKIGLTDGVRAVGNAQLLETNLTRAEILPRRRRANGKVAE